MDYKTHYERLVNRAKNRVLDGYKETHHVIPRCMGGLDNKENLVDLTPEEHYVAHLLLVKIYKNPKLVHAAVMMTVSNRDTSGRNNKLYGWLRRRLQLAAKERCGDKNGSFGKPWYYNPENLKSKKFVPGTEPEGWVKGRIVTGTIRRKHKCLTCNKETKTRLQSYCDNCRPKKKKTIFKSKKVKDFYTEDEKAEALKFCNGNIRQALYKLGLNDSGPNYKMLKKIKEAVYPHATNVLKD